MNADSCHRSKNGIRRAVLIATVLTLALIGAFLDTTSVAVEEPKAPVSETSSIESTHPPPVGIDTIRPIDPTSDISLTDDSIYAVEITVNHKGEIEIIDRHGQRFHLAPGYAPPSITDDFPFLKGDNVSHGDVVRIGVDEVIAKDDVVDGDVICIFGDIVVDGAVTMTVVAIFGHVTVNGFVGGDVIAPMGIVRIGPDAHIGQNVIATRIEKEPGGRIGGTRGQLSFGLGSLGIPLDQMWTRATISAVVLVKGLFFLFLVLLVHVFAARNIVKVKTRMQNSFVKSLAIGVASQVLILPFIILLAVTIIGIPVALFVVPLMTIAAVVMAFAAAGLWLGEAIDKNTGIPLHTQLGRTMGGQVVLWSTMYLALLFWTSETWDSGGMRQFSAFMLMVIFILTAYLAVTVGTGAVLLTRFGTRPKVDPDGTLETTDSGESSRSEILATDGASDRSDQTSTPTSLQSDDSDPAPAVG